MALLARARTARGVGPYDRRQFVDVRAVLEVLHQAAAGDRTGTVRRSMPQLVARLARVMGWARSDDRYADRDAHHASVRRWLRDLQTAGLLSWTIAVDDEGQDVALEFVLRPVPQDMREDELALARRALTYWRRRYGPSANTGARRSLPAIARRGRPLTAAEREQRGRARTQARAEESHTDSAPPFGASPTAQNTPHPQSTPRPQSLEARRGAREHPLVTRRSLKTTAIESSDNNKTAASEREGTPFAPVSVNGEQWQQALIARVRAAETDATRPANRFELEQRARGRRRRALESWPAERALPPSWMLEELWHPRYAAITAPGWSRARLARAVARYQTYQDARPAGFPEGGLAAFVMLADGRAPDWLARLQIDGDHTPQALVLALDRLSLRMRKAVRVAEARRRSTNPRRRRRAQRQLDEEHERENQLRFHYRTAPAEGWGTSRGEHARQNEILRALIDGGLVRWGAYDGEPVDQLIAAYRHRKNDP